MKSQDDALLTVAFIKKGFRHNGKRYESAQVEQRAKEGDEESLLVIAQLVEMQSGIIKIVKGEGGKNE